MARRRRKGKSRKKNINIHPAEIAIVANAAMQLGLPQVGQQLMAGNFVGAANAAAANAQPQNIINAAIPAVGYAFVKPMIANRVPKVKLGNVIVHAL